MSSQKDKKFLALTASSVLKFMDLLPLFTRDHMFILSLKTEEKVLQESCKPKHIKATKTIRRGIGQIKIKRRSFQEQFLPTAGL